MARLVPGAATVAVGLLGISGLQSVPPAASQFDPGPTVFPMSVSIVLVVVGALILVRGARSAVKADASDVPAADGAPRERGDVFALIRTIIALVVFLVLFGFFGFIWSTAAIVGYLCWEFGGSIRRSIIVAIAVPLCEWLVIDVLLHVPLV